MRPPRTLIEPKRRESPRLIPAERDGAVYACWASVARGFGWMWLGLQNVVGLGFRLPLKNASVSQVLLGHSTPYKGNSTE